MGIRVTELTLAATCRFIHTAAILALTVNGITKSGQIISTIAIVATLDAAGIATAVCSGL
jgi:hypothetical protein